MNETTIETPPPPPTEPKPVLLTLQQCRHWIDELSHKQCYLICGPDESCPGYYWRPPIIGGVTKDISEAFRYRVSNAFGYGDVMIQLVDQEVAASIARYKCRAETLLGGPMVELLKLAPLNPTARARVMAVIGQMPPDEMDTWEKIKEWIQTTYEPRPLPPDPSDDPGGFDVIVDFSRRESGTCRYSCTSSGSASYHVSADEIQELLDDNDVDSFSELVSLLRERIMDNPWDLEPFLESDDDSYQYSHYDCHDDDQHCSDISDSTQLHNDLAAHLRRTQSQETIEQIRVPYRVP